MGKVKIYGSFDEYEFDQMFRYLALVSQAIKNEKREFELFVEKTIKDFTTEEKEDFLNFHEEDYDEVAEQFPKLLFSSFLVSWYSIIETQLVNLCRRNNFEIAVRFDENIRLGNGIDKAKLFLQKSVGYDIDPKHWQELAFIRKIRNYIVHNGGRLPITRSEMKKSIPYKVKGEIVHYIKIDNNLFKYLGKYNLIANRGVPILIPTQLFCEHLIEFGKDLVRKVYDDIDMIMVEKYGDEFKNSSADYFSEL